MAPQGSTSPADLEGMYCYWVESLAFNFSDSPHMSLLTSRTQDFLLGDLQHPSLKEGQKGNHFWGVTTHQPPGEEAKH